MWWWDNFREIIAYLEKKFENKISSIEIVEKIDLELINHLSGIKSKFLKLNFKTIGVCVLWNKKLKLNLLGFSFSKKHDQALRRKEKTQGKWYFFISKFLIIEDLYFFI